MGREFCSLQGLCLVAAHQGTHAFVDFGEGVVAWSMQSVASHGRIKSTHTCTNKRKKKKDASNSKSKCIQTKIIIKKKKKDANLHKENQNWKENKKSKTVSMTRCINLTVNQVAVLQYEIQTMCIIIHDDVYQGVYKNTSLFYNTSLFSNICRIQCDNPENIMQLLSLSL